MVHVIENTTDSLKLSPWILTGFKTSHPDSKRTRRAKIISRARKYRVINELAGVCNMIHRPGHISRPLLDCRELSRKIKKSWGQNDSILELN